MYSDRLLANCPPVSEGDSSLMEAGGVFKKSDKQRGGKRKHTLPLSMEVYRLKIGKKTGEKTKVSVWFNMADLLEVPSRGVRTWKIISNCQ